MPKRFTEDEIKTRLRELTEQTREARHNLEDLLSRHRERDRTRAIADDRPIKRPAPRRSKKR